MILNINIGVLGHVDSGKTSLVKCLSEIASTAAFDKNPQSQERGITLDLGFSSFSVPLANHLKGTVDAEKIQYTLVDCPGHASLIKTIIGGSQIIDMMLLVVDVTKGIQTQTAECLVIGEITCKSMIVVLNKIDLVEKDGIEKMKSKIKKAFSATIYVNKDIPIMTTSALEGNEKGIMELIECISKYSSLPKRTSEGPFVFAVDHCFAIKGQGTVLTGTVLQGTAKISDMIEIPKLGTSKKIKSMQMFKQPISKVTQGDRVGICVTQFDPKLLERGVACSPNYGSFINLCIIKVNLIKYFKFAIKTKSKFHISLGHETAMAEVLVFHTNQNDATFDFKQHYEYKDVIEMEENTGTYFILLFFEKHLFATKDALLIGSKLDLDISKNLCRLAFWGKVLEFSKEKAVFLEKVQIYKIKVKTGLVDRVCDSNNVIVKNMFSKEADIQKFVNLVVTFSSGENGRIESSFGQSGKIKVYLPDGFKWDQQLKQEKITVMLEFRKFIFDSTNKIIQ